MKAPILILAFALLIGTASFASNDDDNSIKALKAQKTRVIKNVNSQMDYPQFAIEKNIQGEVRVKFELDKKGNIDIISTNSAQWELEKYVISELKEMKVEEDNIFKGQTYNMKFSFRLQ